MPYEHSVKAYRGLMLYIYFSGLMCRKHTLFSAPSMAAYAYKYLFKNRSDGGSHILRAVIKASRHIRQTCRQIPFCTEVLSRQSP